MSMQELSKAITTRLPTMYFRRLCFLAYHTGKLPSEVARDNIKSYLDLGCLNCGGSISNWEDVGEIQGGVAYCVNGARDWEARPSSKTLLTPPPRTPCLDSQASRRGRYTRSSRS